MELGLRGKVAVVTGGAGAICSAIARGLAAEGAEVSLWDLNLQAAETRASELSATGPQASAFGCDVLDRASVRAALQSTLDRHGTVDILINGAGGSRKEATTSKELSFFDIPEQALEAVLQLNYLSAVLPSQEVGRTFARQGTGAILNISSIAGIQPLSRSISYSSGKAAIINFTQWLAVHMAQEYSPQIRVNAIAPGFVLTEQNRFLLLEQDGEHMTDRGRQVVAFVPMSRLGTPEEMVGAVLYLVSEQARFVTGAVLPVDGGYTAFGGV
ncbi:MAG: SDR family oxidoreductase [Spirochaetales bacterium]|nr:SDR family oxidoreductase [Spirochaetales bacterium]